MQHSWYLSAISEAAHTWGDLHCCGKDICKMLVRAVHPAASALREVPQAESCLLRERHSEWTSPMQGMSRQAGRSDLAVGFKVLDLAAALQLRATRVRLGR